MSYLIKDKTDNVTLIKKQTISPKIFKFTETILSKQKSGKIMVCIIKVKINNLIFENKFLNILTIS